ncbi:MAG: ATP-dependent 6-phosphofructokinase [Alphaproteobacteria bacterium]|nr:ATP-dependent 6-phosphofructokinase [Alphaproteobacteria bacterium]
MTKRIGLLTSGGDCAGLNAAIRAVTHHAIKNYGWKIFGIRKGTTGLLTRPLEYKELTVEFCDHSVLRSGGTLLGSTNRDDPFIFPNADGTKSNRSQEIINGYHELGLDALIGIGGDGSLRILHQLAEQGDLNLVFIPKTIDNDVSNTEVAIGYSTALDIATEALDRLQPTAASHQRIMISEVMGRDAGHIALESGIAGGADIILVPEIPYKLSSIYQTINSIRETGRDFALVVVAESVKKEDGEVSSIQNANGLPRYSGIGHYIAEKIHEATGMETRVNVVGHVQRGGQPNARDRALATAFGVAAVDLVAQNKMGRMVSWQNCQVVDVAISDVVQYNQEVDPNGTMARTAESMGIYVGELPEKK